jgi:hypothetical protein
LKKGKNVVAKELADAAGADERTIITAVRDALGCGPSFGPFPNMMVWGYKDLVKALRAVHNRDK